MGGWMLQSFQNDVYLKDSTTQCRNLRNYWLVFIW